MKLGKNYMGSTKLTRSGSLSDIIDMRALFCSGRSKETCLREALCDQDQYDWCFRSLYEALEEANVEGKNLNSGVLVDSRLNRGDLILNALEFGEGENSTGAQLARFFVPPPGCGEERARQAVVLFFAFPPPPGAKAMSSARL